jgi:hypothetical protein
MYSMPLNINLVIYTLIFSDELTNLVLSNLLTACWLVHLFTEVSIQFWQIEQLVILKP